MTQGSGADTRTATLAYNPEGFVETILDAENRTQSFTYDSAGRVTKQTLPDGREITWSYDANGNVVGITPPGRPNHAFAYTPVDLEEQCTPPTVTGVPQPQTQYAYNLDKQLTTITRPDGQLVEVGYDTAGRTSGITIIKNAIIKNGTHTFRRFKRGSSEVQGVRVDRWSSYRHNAADEPDPPVTAHAIYRALGVHPSDQQRAYRALFDVHLEAQMLDFVRRTTNDGTILGSDRFRQQIEAAIQRRVRKLTHGGDRRSNVYREKPEQSYYMESIPTTLAP